MNSVTITGAYTISVGISGDIQSFTPFEASGNLSGQVETDGTLGVLTSANIVSWSFGFNVANSFDTVGFHGGPVTTNSFGFETLVATETSLSLLGSLDLSHSEDRGDGTSFSQYLRADAGSAEFGYRDVLDSSLYGDTYSGIKDPLTSFATLTDLSAVPVPASLPLAMLGLGLLGSLRRRA